MKIRYVCDTTGLSDRTIRYYIEQGLISPEYTENYLGRKTFNFTQENINELKNIAVLRKFGFTIEEIRDILLDFEKSKYIIQNVKNRTEKAIFDGQEELFALSQIDTEKNYTLAELANKLFHLSHKAPVKNEIIERKAIKTILSKVKAILIFIVVWAPIAFSCFFVAIDINKYKYPVYNAANFFLILAFLFPSFLMLIISKIKFSWKTTAKRVLPAMCVLSILPIFISSLGVVTASQTTDIKNYRNFDADCLANRNIVFQELFPSWPYYFENVKQADETYRPVYLDAKYYYNYFSGMDYTYDIYAEFVLKEDAFQKEVQRVKSVYNKATDEKNYNYKYAEKEKGASDCLILYSGPEPFSMASYSYEYLIFAYDDERNIVRYIYCSSLEDGADQPYYLQLEW